MTLRLLSTQAWTMFVVAALTAVFLNPIRVAAFKNDLSKASNESLLWGPYRPNLYFGMRPRLPRTLLTGLLWSRVEDFSTVQNTFRYTCEQHQGMAGYGWEEYDPRTGGRQVIHDVENQLDMTTEFVKFPGGSHGGSWGVRIKGSPREDSRPDLKTMVVFYAANEGDGILDVENEYNDIGYDDAVTLRGQMEGLGDFKLEVTQGPKSNAHPQSQHQSYAKRPLHRTAVRSVQVPDAALWQGKALLFSELKNEFDNNVKTYGEQEIPPPWAAFQLGTNNLSPSNMYFIQKVFEGPFEFDLIFTSASSSEDITSKDVAQAIISNKKSFSDRFKQVFKATAPFDMPQYHAFSKSLFSNLVGGIGFFHGDHIVDRSYALEYDEENEGFWEETAHAQSREQFSTEGPFSLLTSVPSRPFFPRGFLWDEGFHLLPVLDWDADLTLEIARSWFSLIDDDGWIAREQILGAEARSKVPPEFQVQYPHYANPPTLFLLLQSLIDKISHGSLSPEQKGRCKTQLEELYPLLKRQYLWFRRTQFGGIKSYERLAFSTKEAYRWRGRTPRHILPSGLDDYPRAQPPHPGELHVDLISWIGMMNRALQGIASFLDEREDVKQFSKQGEAIARNIDDLHWSEEQQTYCDATIDAFEDSIHVCHQGYISLFPFITGLLSSDSKNLGAVLDLIADPERLWSRHGIRSLSKRDELYGTDENYWRSPVWMNINYLIVHNLLRIAQQRGPQQPKARSIYINLRNNLVETVYNSWKTTGFAWEQYNPDTGEGQRTQHFTGWTSLIVKIMCMPDLSGAVAFEHGEL